MLPRRLVHTLASPSLPAHAHRFSTSSMRYAHRAIVFSHPGEPADVLSALTYPSLPPPPPRALTIRFRLSPVNPSDVNVVEGVYPNKPAPTTSLGPGQQLQEPVYVPGNEGLAEVVSVGDGVDGLAEGDWVVMAKQQAGTWSSARTVGVEDVIRLPKDEVSEVNAATISVNPPTAYNMLRDFVDLTEGDWVIQNGANSAVGQAVIQIAARRGLKTLNFVRDRPDLDALKKELTEIGATGVHTYDELNDKSLVKQLKLLMADRPPRLLLNCVSGPTTLALARLLGPGAHVVSYGAMSKQPLMLPTGALIWKGLKAEGYFMSQWYKDHGREARESLFKELIALKLKEPAHEMVVIPGTMSDEEAGERVREVMRRIAEGRYGRKVLLRVEDPVQ
ncbi:NAD(P)-binding protein [Laetiporus sulphureus 93-53]|uniref:enoyl-[acyl-carrier-protein] reductase n=1 Tax=Laetiporus sulphureus 93-53 TaxID=1314785 RepID=A0A165G8Z4_9APHY|nr:NAD(P)-binding protein [Laetiporus sulphureus 93-53]KZT09998.1 NAD(P)-binding protein [Laetiporus sulphureus 93-53]